MEYYEKLGLKKEPFSTSPDPEFFYMTAENKFALEKIKSAIKTKKGLSFVLGDVGAGKTTLARMIIAQFCSDDYIVNMLLNPVYESEYQFLACLVRLLTGTVPPKSSIDCQDALKDFLFEKGINGNKTIILLVDEGQKLALTTMELLRILLNYETNEHKLLQLVIFSQLEIMPKLKRIRNFEDRICVKYFINPLSCSDTGKMIHFRLSRTGMNAPEKYFPEKLIALIYEKSLGYPRKITMICRDLLENMFIMNKNTIDDEVLKTVFRDKD